ncbi:SDR family oxidoreductase [Polyangium sp. 15x6]|uniref:SDR family NAD(P)-dependent oxidoreductase n=1 Tax=Polyangium sp. 15x6 TaxID=3042687 RepID=UPI00249A5474|nr:SDR family oxidoreductase [Polyangium sp. 15x6]MDI3285988.1 SDR family oxidoreductase [Polyangium sp. 15x6]
MAKDNAPIEGVDAAAWETCLRVLRAAIERPAAMPDREALERLAARIYKRARKERRKVDAAGRREHDRGLLEEVLVARENGRALEVSGGDTVPLLAGSRRCYVCSALFRELHRRYHLLCPTCAAFHESKRAERLDLRGRRALITGARVKIGHATALRMLRSGAELIATSRFAAAARRVFERAPDFEEWRDRVHVLSADFRDPRQAERLAAEVTARFGSLDILVNNAAQTVLRPEEGRLAAGDVESVAEEDRREVNGWTLHLEDVSAEEILDVMHVNAAAPLLLTARLLPALRASRHHDRYVVNVVGLDGQLERPMKLARHPHVNAGKAALNMLTRTCSEELSGLGIFMNSVDVGWVTHEGAWSVRHRMRAQGFAPPLDTEDAAARICDPIARGLAGAPVFGRVWKDFHEGTW